MHLDKEQNFHPFTATGNSKTRRLDHPNERSRRVNPNDNVFTSESDLCSAEAT